MNFRNTVCRLLALAGLAVAIPSCAGGGTTREDPASEGGEILKISYYRAYPEPRTKRLEPMYRVVMSESWRDRMGESPKEPIARGAPGKIYVGFLSDAELSRYVKQLKSFGLEDLEPRNPDQLNPDEFRRKALDANETSYTRVITVGSDKGAKSYYYRDQQVRKDLIEKFVKCEAFVSRISENSIQVRTMSEPIVPRER
jgi:hypothetical protein